MTTYRITIRRNSQRVLLPVTFTDICEARRYVKANAPKTGAIQTEQMMGWVFCGLSHQGAAC
jgi:hypothetical protein